MANNVPVQVRGNLKMKYKQIPFDNRYIIFFRDGIKIDHYAVGHRVPKQPEQNWERVARRRGFNIETFKVKMDRYDRYLDTSPWWNNPNLEEFYRPII